MKNLLFIPFVLLFFVAALLTSCSNGNLSDTNNNIQSLVESELSSVRQSLIEECDGQFSDAIGKAVNQLNPSSHTTTPTTNTNTITNTNSTPSNNTIQNTASNAWQEARGNASLNNGERGTQSRAAALKDGTTGMQARGNAHKR